MGFRCERCEHEWVPRAESEEGPTVCPKCKSPYWAKPRKSATSYEAFCKAVSAALKQAGRPITWTEVRTAARLPQAFPNNKWVRRMETDIGLKRERDARGIIHWHISNETPAETANEKGARTRRK